MKMVRHFVWDVPTRLFHWLLVALIGFSWWSAENHEMEWHYRSGLAICAIVIFRVIWGLVGTQSARFAHFVKGPAAVSAYVRSQAPVRLGHNPLGGWSVIALIGLMVLQVGTGLFAVDVDGLESGPLSMLVEFDTGRALAGAHEIAFKLLQLLVIVHVVAVLFYLMAKRRNLIGAMVTGYQKEESDLAVEPIRRVSVLRLGGALAIALACTYAISKGLWL